MPGQGIILQKRDVEFLHFLAWGPGRVIDAFPFYKDIETNKKEISASAVYLRLKKLEKAGFIKRRVYPSLQRSVLYYLSHAGIAEIIFRYGFEASSLRYRVVPDREIHHELIIAKFLRRLWTESTEANYKIAGIMGDSQMKYQSQFARGKYYADLSITLEVANGKSVQFLAEIDGLRTVKDRFQKKVISLSSLEQPLFVISYHEERLPMLLRYSLEALRRPMDIYFCSIQGFELGGLLGTEFLTFPGNVRKKISFKTGNNLLV
jgi:hypothetical protein